MPSEFLTLNDLILPPPLPAMVSILLLAGSFEFSDLALRRVRLDPSPVERAGAFVLLMAICGGLVHAMALAHLATLPVLRFVAGVIVAGGAVAFATRWQAGMARVAETRRYWAQAGVAERVALAVVASTVTALFLTACGPVTDIDSLDYHPGVPLDWLRHGGVTPQPHWLTVRLTGLGEAINMLGLAAGTDGLGAMIQVSGLVALLLALGSLAKNSRDRALALLLVITPAVLPLATAQKPQLFPIAAVAVGMILALTAKSRLDFVLAFACAAFAMSCKYSFYAPGAMVFVVALVRASKQHRLRFAAGCAIAAAALFAGPVLGRNVQFYGDPFSPFLEGLKQHPDASVSRFAAELASAGEPHTLRGLLTLLLRLFIPSGPGSISTLGAGMFALCFASQSPWSRSLLICSAIVTVLVLWRGQLAPRFLLEPYFFCAMVAVAAPWSKPKAFLFHSLIVQSCVVAIAALVGTGLIFPGALTRGLRQRVMQEAALGYAQALWMDKVIPRGETVMVESRAYAFFPRPFVIPWCQACDSATFLEMAVQQEGKSGVSRVVVAEFPFEGAVPANCSTRTLAGPQTFPFATRNPFNWREYQAIALRVECR